MIIEIALVVAMAALGWQMCDLYAWLTFP